MSGHQFGHGLTPEGDGVVIPRLHPAQQLRQFGLGFVRTHFDVHSISPSIDTDRFIDQFLDVKSFDVFTWTSPCPDNPNEIPAPYRDGHQHPKTRMAQDLRASLDGNTTVSAVEITCLLGRYLFHLSRRGGFNAEVLFFNDTT